jgi:hypothetical protein
MATSLCQAVKTEKLDQGDHRIAQSSQHLGCIITPNTRSIFAHHHVTHSMQFVLNKPVFTPAGENGLQIDLVRRQAEQSMVNFTELLA